MEALHNSEYNWGMSLEPQHHACLGMENNKCSLVQGKGLGGTSSINAMLYTRGNSLDYDRWADEEELRSWCYDHVLPYFKKSEDVYLDHFDNKFHSKGGPLHVENVPHQSPLAKTFIEAANHFGAHTVDYNGRYQLGVGLTQATTSHGKRMSSAAAFLAPAVHRKNLDVSIESPVTEILIGEHTHEAKGVKYLKEGKIHTAKAKKEVILTAGLFNSPKLLMVSGVGPKAHLEQHGIPVKVPLEGVGKNLQDHMEFLGLNFLVNNTEALYHPDLKANLKLWLTEGKGPLTRTQNIEALAYLKTKASKEAKDYPDMELQFISRPFNSDNGQVFKRAVGLTDETYAAVFEPLHGHYIYAVHPVLLHPKSTGHVELSSKNPLHHPKIYGEHFSDPDAHDIETMVEGIKLALDVAQAEPFQKWGIKLAEVQVPGCEAHEHGSSDYWKCCVRKLTVPHSHGGTCKMGSSKDKKAVVDEHLKVHGVKGLRIADSSVIPNALSGHSTVPTIMIGEKAADLIKESWK